MFSVYKDSLKIMNFTSKILKIGNILYIIIEIIKLSYSYECTIAVVPQSAAINYLCIQINIY